MILYNHTILFVTNTGGEFGYGNTPSPSTQTLAPGKKRVLFALLTQVPAPSAKRLPYCKKCLLIV